MEPLSYSQIESWMLVTGNKPEGREVRVLRALDRLYWETIND